MSLRAIRSRFRNCNESDQGSPSRSTFLNQLATLMMDDRSPEDQDNQPDEELCVDANENTDNAESTSAQIGPPLRNQQLRQLLQFTEDSCSDRDTDADDSSAAVSRNRVDRPARHRFAGRDKRTRSHRCKSLDRSGLTMTPATSTTDEPIDAPVEGNRAAVNDSGHSSRLPHHRVADWARQLIDDLQSIDDVNDKDEEDPGNPLTLKRLKNNIVRFGRATKPVSTYSDSIGCLRQWDSPTASLLFVMILCYSIWHGLLLPLLVTAAIWKLTINYLISQGWFDHFGWTSDGRSAEESGSTGDKSSSGVADRFALLLQVARKVQNRLGDICDAAEKIKNLLMWRHEACRRLYLMLWLALPITVLVPASQLMTGAAYYLIFKCFVVDYLFLRFPKLRAKYDTRLWQSLPTDADVDARNKVEQGLSNAAVSGSTETRTFWESFNLPPSEIPQPGWQNGQRGTLVNRDKSLTSSFKTGRLFLTNNYLCFERSKTHPQKNVVIPLDRITRLEKGNQYSWIPGGGMIIEVFVQGFDRAYTFGAIMNRDEIFTAIRDAASQRGCVWQEDKSPAAPSSPADKL